MTSLATGSELRPGKYARVERERRWLLSGLPVPAAEIARVRHIRDRYFTGAGLRLRMITGGTEGDPPNELKLTQKLPAAAPGPVQGLITNTYLSRAAYDLLAQLPGHDLAKARYSVPPLGIDVFDAPLSGLVIGEAEFDSDEEVAAFVAPTFAVAEVTADLRFTGGRLAQASREEVASWLQDYGIMLG